MSGPGLRQEPAFQSGVLECAQIDLRYANSKQGDVIVIVAPVLRFKVGFSCRFLLVDSCRLSQSRTHPATMPQQPAAGVHVMVCIGRVWQVLWGDVMPLPA